MKKCRKSTNSFTMDKSKEFDSIQSCNRSEVASVACQSLIQCLDGAVSSRINGRRYHRACQEPCRRRMSSHPDFVRGTRSVLIDRNDVQYLDCTSGVSHVGHCHPKVVEACRRSLSRGLDIPCSRIFDTGDIFTSNSDDSYTKRILKTLPEHLDSAYVFQSGSTANDVAIQLSRSYTNHEDVIVFEDAFHGSLGTVSEISPKTFSKEHKQQDWVHVLPVPDLYRGPYRENDPDALEKYFRDAKEILRKKLQAKRKFACLIAEPLFTFHHFTLIDQSYFAKIVNFVQSLGALIIIDEVQTGLGRLGQSLWGFEMLDIRPDIVTTGKPLGNGFPMSLLVTSQRIASSLGSMLRKNGPSFTQAAVGHAVLDVMEQENLLHNAGIVGKFIKDTVNSLKMKYDCIGDIRGSGLLLGIEIVQDRVSRAPDPEKAEEIIKLLLEEHIMISREGGTIAIIPPLCFSIEDAKKLLHGFEIALAKLESEEQAHYWSEAFICSKRQRLESGTDDSSDSNESDDSFSYSMGKCYQDVD